MNMFELKKLVKLKYYLIPIPWVLLVKLKFIIIDYKIQLTNSKERMIKPKL